MWEDPGSAEDHALEMIAAGADIIDVGGESTRPRGVAYGEGARAVSAEEELRRVVPVIRRLAARLTAPISVDTTKAAVARAALDAGATMVNDVSGFRADPAMAGVVAAAGAAGVVMHMRGTPQTMHGHATYADVTGEVLAELGAALADAAAAGVDQLIGDPGFGFAKTRDQNLELLRHLRRFHALGRPLLVGVSRKAFIGELTGLPVGERLEGSLAAMTAAILNGAHIVRVHDVGAAVRAARVADALRPGP
jgi:dihydropteroate synthase